MSSAIAPRESISRKKRVTASRSGVTELVIGATFSVCIARIRRAMHPGKLIRL